MIADQDSGSVSVASGRADEPGLGGPDTTLADPVLAVEGLPEEEFEALIRKGRALGGLTQDDVVTVLRRVELDADLIATVVHRIRAAGIEFTYDTGESTVVPLPTPPADDLSVLLADPFPAGTGSGEDLGTDDPVPTARIVTLEPARPAGVEPTHPARTGSRPESGAGRGGAKKSAPPAGRHRATPMPTTMCSGDRRPTRSTCT